MADEKLPARRPNVPLEQPPTGGSILGKTQERFQIPAQYRNDY